MKKLIKPSILSLSLLIIITGSALSPALGEIKKSFPAIDENIVKLILTLPSIIIIPFSLLSGKLSLTISKRKIIILAIILYVIGGVGGGCCNNLYVILIFRAIIGIGAGLLLPLSRSLIADFYTGNRRTNLMGVSNAVSNLGAVVATLISGFLASINWRYTFLVYLIGIFVLVLVIVGLPEPPKRKENKNNIKSINHRVLLISILTILLNIGFYCSVTNIAIFLESKNIGSSNTAGMAMSSLTLAGFLGGIILEKISRALRGFRISISLLIMSIGFITLKYTSNIYTVLLSMFMIGFAQGIIKPIIFLKVTKVTPKFSNSFSISIISSSVFLGKFLSPIVLDIIGNLFNNNSIGFLFFFTGISILFSSFVFFIIKIKH
ncbi:MFS transporter [Dethiothermospora halolimnae]|uniref:MFS transporter n=1 Tax=Dethiothermospora halolimnae TaxID=3114390 RepID=UPI003CCBEC90